MKKIYLLLSVLFYANISAAQNLTAANNSYFPIAVWLQGTQNAQAYKNAGVNMYVGLYNALNQTQLTDLTNAKMRVICGQNSFALAHLSDTLIYGWNQQDEPDNAQWNATTQTYDPCIAPSVIINNYNTLKANDPSRPVYLNLGQGVSYINWVGRGTCTGNTDLYKVSKNGYLKGGDIGSFDIYPVNSSDVNIKDKLWYVAKGIDSLKIWSGNKPSWCWIECTQIDADSPRKPTPSEVKSEVWMALVHGAKGFGYFCHSWTPTFVEPALLQDATMLAAVKIINEQVTSLAAVLNSSSTSGYASVSSSNTSVPVDFMTKNYGGANYVFAVAMRSGTTAATFSVASGSVVEVLGENRTLSVSGGKFTDNFSSFGVHLYKITSAATAVKAGNKISSVNVYPNPSFGTLSIDMSGLEDEQNDIKILSSVGVEVYRGSCTNGNKTETIDIAHLPKGVYFLQIYNQSGSITEQIIIQ
jgi:hypothetical protein